MDNNAWGASGGGGNSLSQDGSNEVEENKDHSIGGFGRGMTGSAYE